MAIAVVVVVGIVLAAPASAHHEDSSSLAQRQQAEQAAAEAARAEASRTQLLEQAAAADARGAQAATRSRSFRRLGTLQVRASRRLMRGAAVRGRVAGRLARSSRARGAARVAARRRCALVVRRIGTRRALRTSCRTIVRELAMRRAAARMRVRGTALRRRAATSFRRRASFVRESQSAMYRARDLRLRAAAWEPYIAATRSNERAANAGLSLWMTATFRDGFRTVVYRGDKDLSHYTYELCDGTSQKVDLRGGTLATVYVVGPFDSPIRWINFKAGRDHEGRTFTGSTCGADEPLPPAPPIDGDPCPSTTQVRGWSDTNYLYSIKLGTCPGNWVNFWYEPYVTTSYGNALSNYTIGHGFGEIELRGGTRVKWNTNPNNSSAIWWVSVTRPDGRTATVVDKSYVAGPGMSTDTMLPMTEGELWEFARRLRACAGPLNQPLSCRPGASAGTPTASFVVTPPMYAGESGTATLWTPQDAHRNAYVFATLDGSDCAGTAIEQYRTPGTQVLDVSPLSSDLVEIPFLIRQGGRYLVCAYVADRSDAIPVTIERAEMQIAQPHQSLALDATPVGGGIHVEAAGESTVARNLYVTVRREGTACLFDVNTEQVSSAQVVMDSPSNSGHTAIEQDFSLPTGRQYLVCAWLVASPFERPDLLRSMVVTAAAPHLDARIDVAADAGVSRVSVTSASNVGVTADIAIVPASTTCANASNWESDWLDVGRTIVTAVGTPTATPLRACARLTSWGTNDSRLVEQVWTPTAGTLRATITPPGATIVAGAETSLSVAVHAPVAGLELVVWSSDRCDTSNWGMVGQGEAAVGASTMGASVAVARDGMVCSGLRDAASGALVHREARTLSTRAPALSVSTTVPSAISGSITIAASGSSEVTGWLSVVSCDGTAPLWGNQSYVQAGAFPADFTLHVGSWTSAPWTADLCVELRSSGWSVLASVPIGRTVLQPLSTDLRIEPRSTAVVGSEFEVAVVGSSSSWSTVIVGVEEWGCGAEPGAFAATTWISAGTVDARTRVRVPSATASWLCAYAETGDDRYPYALLATGRFTAVAPTHDVTLQLPATTQVGSDIDIAIDVDGNAAASVVLRRGFGIDCSTPAAPGDESVVTSVDVASGASRYLVRVPAGSVAGTQRWCANTHVTMADGSTFDRAVASATIEVEAAATDPAPTDPAPTDPAPTDPAPTDPAPTDPAPTDPAPTDPAPTDPAPTDPGATDPAPTDPAPTDPAPTDPAPTDPAPTDPAPTDPAPTDPAPTDPAPTDPAPTDPAPTDPAPTDPAPTDPAPTDPAPTDPAPTDPAPTDPAPTAPGPWAPAPSGTNDVVSVTATSTAAGRLEAAARGIADVATRVELVALRRAPHCSPTLEEARARTNAVQLGGELVAAGSFDVDVATTVASAGTWRVCAYLTGSGTTLAVGGADVDVRRR